MKKKVIRVSAVPESLYTLLDGQLKFLSKYYEVIALSSKSKLLEDLAKKEDIKRTIGINIERRISLFKDIQSLIKLILVFRKEKPAMVHSITPKAGLLSMLAAKFSNVPVRVHTFTGLVFPTSTGLKRKILILTDKLTCWAATDIIPEGEGVMNDLEKFKITSKPLKIIANGNVNGINTSYFKIRDERKVTNNRFTFCFIGRLVGDKGINELVTAFVNLYKLRPNIELVLVGPFEKELDPIHPEVEHLIFNHPAIKFKGFQKDVRPFLANADVFVFPSYREGFPNVVLQAGAMGLPSIVTDINGSNEIISDGVNGKIIPSKDADALLHMMRHFVDHPLEVEQMASDARDLIVKRYEQHIVWEALLAEYQKLLN
ncbi:glycosyltransferase family 4 protein [Marinifilum fragile]|uniref:glycosyltransferase family 4 protein n=1 Tax=Marinifilum fragile TaxID=570161 RepID=UPI0006CFA1CA|nr:glycosyltransferase family 4 protein [Marinifilum fragile]